METNGHVTNGHVNGESHVNGSEVEASQFPVIESEPPKKKKEPPMAKLAEVVVTDYMKECLDKVALAEGFKNYDAKIDHGSGIGDGFVGIMFKATIQEKDSDKKLPIVLKTPPTNEARRNAMGSMGAFEREVYMYNEVLPELFKFQQERKIKPNEGFFAIPKCYLAEYNVEKNDSILIMEDLRESGHKMWSKYKPINLEHAKLVFAELGRFHAVSFALKAQKPELFEKYKSLTDLLTTTMMENGLDVMLKQSLERAINTLDESDTKRRARAKILIDNTKQVFRDLVNPKLAEPYAVITHGDCWSNNFMFHYKRGFPVRTVLLDWQISRYCSPVLDLAYFCFVCTDAPMRAKHYDELLNIYHRSLKDLLDHLGGDTQSQFPFTAFMRQLKQFGKFGVIMASLALPMMATRPEDMPDMDFMAENMGDDPEMLAEMMKNFLSQDDGYNTRMKGNMLDTIRYGYL